MSHRMGERVGAVKHHKKKVTHTDSNNSQDSQQQSGEDGQDSQKEEAELLSALAKKRAEEVVKQLDLNRDGYITEDEFVQGCLIDGDFFKLISCFDGVIPVWSDLQET